MLQTSNADRAIPTRRISFEESLQALPRHFAADGDIINSHLTAALSSVFPDGEDFFVRSVRHFRNDITDPVLKKQVGGFIGQEAIHGREHRALNVRLDELGYHTRFVEKLTEKGLALRTKLATPKANLAATAALEHFTATLAELVLSSEETRDLFGHEEVRNLFVWHALEESEHKAVAFDVYKAVGGGERTRVWTMKFLRYGFLLAMVVQVSLGLLLDRETYRRGKLRRSLRQLRRSPIVNRELWEQLKDYDRPDFHPDDRDTNELVAQWRTELFGDEGSLNDKLVGAGRVGVIDGMEHLDVLVVGAGLSGIGAGHHLQTDCPWASYAIFEARDAIGGTWDLFRYPGLRSDSDMYTLGYSFRPWEGEKAIADGASILQYIRDTAAEEGIEQHIRFQHRILTADWSTEHAHWLVTAERTDTGERIQLTAGFLFSCGGYYRYDHGHQPDFPGLDRFQGQVIHPQAWPEDLDLAGRRVVVIGSGATAITLIPSLAATAEHVTMLQRSPSYIATVPAKDPLALALRRVLPRRLSGPTVRWYKAVSTQAFFQVSQRWPGAVKRILCKGVERQLPAGYDVDTHFTPSYDPWDQRVCVVPDGDLFKAIRRGDASVVTDHVDTFTDTGIRLRSGAELDADVVVTATGLELLFLGGIDASVDGEPIDLPSKLTYKGMMLEGVPNLAVAIGYTNASWTLKCDLTCQYVTKLLTHLRATGQRQCTPVNDDASVGAEPLLGLSSGYIQRAAGQFPKQGSRFPWQVHQSYLRDYRALKISGIHDDAMVFSNPVPVPAAPALAVAATA